MMFKPLGHDKFDKQVLGLIQMNPDRMLKLVFSTEPSDENANDQNRHDAEALMSHFDGYTDLHGKDINAMHLVC